MPVIYIYVRTSHPFPMDCIWVMFTIYTNVSKAIINHPYIGGFKYTHIPMVSTMARILGLLKKKSWYIPMKYIIYIYIIVLYYIISYHIISYYIVLYNIFILYIDIVVLSYCFRWQRFKKMLQVSRVAWILTNSFGSCT